MNDIKQSLSTESPTTQAFKSQETNNLDLIPRTAGIGDSELIKFSPNQRKELN